MSFKAWLALGLTPVHYVFHCAAGAHRKLKVVGSIPAHSLRVSSALEQDTEPSAALWLPH